MPFAPTGCRQWSGRAHPAAERLAIFEERLGYGDEGVDARGILAVWSATVDAGFTLKLVHAGFEVSLAEVNAHRDGDSADHVIWFAKKPDRC